MIPSDAVIARTLEWAVASAAQPGEATCGDHFVVRDHTWGGLVGVVDGTGHGEQAATIAGRVVAMLNRYDREPLVSLFQRCHRALLGTRGAVMSLARFEEGRMSWTGVGNVRGVLRRRRAVSGPLEEGIVLRGGVLGFSLPSLWVSMVPVAPGDVLVFATDGIRPDFAEGIDPRRPLQPLVDHILSRYRSSADDALVLAARYIKGGP